MRFRRVRAAWRCVADSHRGLAASQARRVARRGGGAALLCASFVAVAKSLVGRKMLFGKRKQVVKRILIVEDEPLTAFDNENILGDAGYEIVATVDGIDEAIEALENGEVHLVLSDLRLKEQQSGIQLAAAAKAKSIPTLLAT